MLVRNKETKLKKLTGEEYEYILNGNIEEIKKLFKKQFSKTIAEKIEIVKPEHTLNYNCYMKKKNGKLRKVPAEIYNKFKVDVASPAFEIVLNKNIKTKEELQNDINEQIEKILGKIEKYDFTLRIIEPKYNYSGVKKFFKNWGKNIEIQEEKDNSNIQRTDKKQTNIEFIIDNESDITKIISLMMYYDIAGEIINNSSLTEEQKKSLIEKIV